jgi:predicted DCC family thiol-disulfide oxidoreductase YuxK
MADAACQSCHRGCSWINMRRMETTSPSRPAIVLFDGDCALCNGTARFIAERDSKKRIALAPLASQAGCQALAIRGIVGHGDSIMLLDANGRTYAMSDAVLKTAELLDWPWPLLGLAKLVPRTLRDIVYRAVARVRYRWFGKADGARCAMHLPAVRERLLPGWDAPASKGG